MNRIGIDLGGSKIEALISTENPLEALFKKRIPTERHKGYKHIVGAIASLVGEMKQYASNPHDITIGVGMPGSPHPKTGLIRNANTTALNGMPFGDDLKKALNCDVSVANDANCLTLSEALYGSAKGYATVCGIIMGTGMGGGIFRDNRMIVGANGNSGEFGHGTIEPFGSKCWCGRRGCVELYLSGTGIENHYRLRSGQQASVLDIYNLYKSGDTPATETIHNFLNFFALVFGNVYRLFTPDVFVFGGGVSNLPILYAEGADRFFEMTGVSRNDVRFLKNALGDSSGIYGASLLPDLTS